MLKEGTKWALAAKSLIGRNENSVKNRYLTLLNLHLKNRKKQDCSVNQTKEKIKDKIEEIKLNIMERDQMATFKRSSEMYLKTLGSENFIKEHSLKKYDENENKNFQKHPTFSQLPSQKMFLELYSTKDSFSKVGSSQEHFMKSNPASNNNVMKRKDEEFATFGNFPSIDNVLEKNKVDELFNFPSCDNVLEKKKEDHFFLLKKHSQLMSQAHEINNIKENSSEEEKDELIFPIQMNENYMANSLSKSFSRMSVSSPNKKLATSPLLQKKRKINEERNERDWTLKSDHKHFDSFSSISKTDRSLLLLNLKQPSNSSIVSLSDGSNLRSNDKGSFVSSSLSRQEKKYLMSAINNLRSDSSSLKLEGSKTSNVSSVH